MGRFYDSITIKNVSEEKTMCIAIDNKLTFKSHLKNICKKPNQKLKALVKKKQNSHHPFKGKLCQIPS